MQVHKNIKKKIFNSPFAYYRSKIISQSSLRLLVIINERYFQRYLLRSNNTFFLIFFLTYFEIRDCTNFIVNFLKRNNLKLRRDQRSKNFEIALHFGERLVDIERARNNSSLSSYRSNILSQRSLKIIGSIQEQYLNHIC